MTDDNKTKYPNQHPNRSTTTIPQKPVPEIEWNQNDIKAYQDIGLQVPSDTCMFQKRFLSLVDVRQGPIERTVTHIVRQKAPDYLSLKEDDTTTKKPDRKEYIIYRERWEGKDIRGVPLIQQMIIGKAFGQKDSQDQLSINLLEKCRIWS